MLMSLGKRQHAWEQAGYVKNRYLMNGSIDSIKAKANIVRAGDARGRLLVHAFGFLAPALKIKFNGFSVSPWHDCLMPLSKNFRRSVLVSFVSSSSRSALNYFRASLHHGTSSLPTSERWCENEDVQGSLLASALNDIFRRKSWKWNFRIFFVSVVVVPESSW